MTIAYWIVGGITALLWLVAGGQKTFRSREALAPMMAWAPTFPAAAVKAIGIAEILGALGLILPPLTGIAPWLAFVAAIALLLVQVIAIVFHLVRGEVKVLGFNALITVLTAVTVWLATIWL